MVVSFGHKHFKNETSDNCFETSLKDTEFDSRVRISALGDSPSDIDNLCLPPSDHQFGQSPESGEKQKHLRETFMKMKTILSRRWVPRKGSSSFPRLTPPLSSFDLVHGDQVSEEILCDEKRSVEVVSSVSGDSGDPTSSRSAFPQSTSPEFRFPAELRRLLRARSFVRYFVFRNMNRGILKDVSPLKFACSKNANKGSPTYSDEKKESHSGRPPLSKLLDKAVKPIGRVLHKIWKFISPSHWRLRSFVKSLFYHEATIAETPEKGKKVRIPKSSKFSSCTNVSQSSVVTFTSKAFAEGEDTIRLSECPSTSRLLEYYEEEQTAKVAIGE